MPQIVVIEHCFHLRPLLHAPLRSGSDDLLSKLYYARRKPVSCRSSRNVEVELLYHGDRAVHSSWKTLQLAG